MARFVTDKRGGQARAGPRRQGRELGGTSDPRLAAESQGFGRMLISESRLFLNHETIVRFTAYGRAAKLVENPATTHEEKD